MPRGKYDRKESRIHRLEADLAKNVALVKAMKDDLEKKDIELKAAKKLAEVASKLPTQAQIVPSEKFTVLRDNLRSLSEARQALMSADGTSSDVLEQLDHEITAHLRLIGCLRSESFKSVETASDKPDTVSKPQPTGGQAVPLPQAPGFLTPTFASVKTLG